MNRIKFDWDAKKARQNIKKHKVSFEEASTLFYDENAIEFYDPEHSKSEDRFLMLGMSGRLRIIIVSYCLRSKGVGIRIISARLATEREAKVYIERKK